MLKSTNLIHIITFLAVFFFFSCTPRTKTVTVAPLPEIKPVPTLPADVVDKKISDLEGLIENNMIAEEDMDIALGLLSDYRKIKSLIGKPVSESENQEIINILFRDLSKLDEKALSKHVKPEKETHPQPVEDFFVKRKIILDRYLSGDYQGVIDECVELESAFGPDSLTSEIGLLFAESLSKRGMLKEAVNIGEKIVRELEGKPDIIYLRADLIEWLLELGKRDKAAQSYEKLTDNLDEREVILGRVKNSMEGLTQEKGPYVQKAPPGEGPGKEVGSSEPQRIETILKEVEKLVGKHDFMGAEMLLIKGRLRLQDDPNAEVLEQAFKTVELAEERYRDRLSNQRKTIEMARRLIDEEKYEEAISSLEPLENSNENDIDVQKIKDLAVEKLINREINRAAKIFLQAKKASDPKRKKELLLNSHDILKKLVEKYPSSTMINKLNNYLMRVNDELKRTGDQTG